MSHRFAADLVPGPRDELMVKSGRQYEITIRVTRDDEPFQTFVVVVDRSVLKVAGADPNEATARALATIMQPAVRETILDGRAPSPTDLELTFTDGRALAETLRDRPTPTPDRPSNGRPPPT
jgi:hypothetical protein